MKIKVLDKLEDGTVEEFYVDNFDDKKLFDRNRKLQRMLNNAKANSDHDKKNIKKLYKQLDDNREKIKEFKTKNNIK